MSFDNCSSNPSKSRTSNELKTHSRFTIYAFLNKSQVSTNARSWLFTTIAQQSGQHKTKILRLCGVRLFSRNSQHLSPLRFISNQLVNRICIAVESGNIINFIITCQQVIICKQIRAWLWSIFVCWIVVSQDHLAVT